MSATKSVPKINEKKVTSATKSVPKINKALRDISKTKASPKPVYRKGGNRGIHEINIPAGKWGARLGVITSKATGRCQGVAVTHIIPNSFASGVMDVGDVIVAMNGKAFHTMGHLGAKKFILQAGKEGTALRIVRDGQGLLAIMTKRKKIAKVKGSISSSTATSLSCVGGKASVNQASREDFIKHGRHDIMCLPEGQFLTDRTRLILENIELFENEVKITKDGVDTTVRSVGVRCKKCMDICVKKRAMRWYSCPSSIVGLQASIRNVAGKHLPVCTMVPQVMKDDLARLSKKQKGPISAQDYMDNVVSVLGLVDDCYGVSLNRGVSDKKKSTVKCKTKDSVVAHPTHVKKTVKKSVKRQCHPKRNLIPATASNDIMHNRDLIFARDQDLVPSYVYLAMKQVEACQSKMSGLIGLQCKHCGFCKRNFAVFPSSLRKLGSGFESLMKHVIKCKMCPDGIRDLLSHLKTEQVRQSTTRKPSFMPIFFRRVWCRLHDEIPSLGESTSVEKDNASDVVGFSRGDIDQYVHNLVCHCGDADDILRNKSNSNMDTNEDEEIEPIVDILVVLSEVE